MAAILLFGIVRRVPVFDVFLEGAKDGLRSAVSILPSLIGLLMAVRMLKASGALDFLTGAAAPVLGILNVPPEITPLIFLRPVSGSGSTALLLQIYKSCGPDSFAGRAASVIAGSTDTTFYAIAVYFGAVGIRKIRYTVPAALAADCTCCVLALLTTGFFFGQ